MTARDDAIDSRLRAAAQYALAELSRAPGYSRDVPQGRRRGSMRTLALAGGLAGAVGVGGAAIGIGLHNAGQHGTVPTPAGSPTPPGPSTPTAAPTSPSPSASPVPGSLGNDLIYSADGPDAHGLVSVLAEHDWTWAVRGQLTLPHTYQQAYVVASPHGSHVLLVDGPVVGYTDASGGTTPTKLTAMSSNSQTTNVSMPSGLVLTSLPKWSDDDSVVCASAGKANSSGTGTTTDDLYILSTSGAPRKMSVPTLGLYPSVLACSPTKDLMVVELIRQGGIDGSPGGPDEVYVVRMSTGAVLRHFTLPKPVTTQDQTTVAVSPDATLLAISPALSAGSAPTIVDSVSGRTLATLSVLEVNFFAGSDSTVVATDASHRTVLMEWRTGRTLSGDWFAQQGVTASAFMFHAGRPEILVEFGPAVYLVDASGQQRQVSASSYVLGVS